MLENVFAACVAFHAPQGPETTVVGVVLALYPLGVLNRSELPERRHPHSARSVLRAESARDPLERLHHLPMLVERGAQAEGILHLDGHILEIQANVDPVRFPDAHRE